MTDITQELTELSTDDLIIGEHRSVVQTYKRAPMVVSHGAGMTVWDTEGSPYLDFAAGIAVNALGHSDPGMQAVIAEQAGKLIHTSNLYYTVPMIQLAERLTSNSFADKVFFTNSGTEANEAAIKFVRQFHFTHGHAGKSELVCFDHAFHGRTMGSLALTPKPAYQDAFRPLLPGVVVAQFGDTAALESVITERTQAVFLEPIQGEGGIHPASAEFLQALRARCDAVGALLVFDEVQCGLGRTGDLWAHTASGITPDLMTLAKPLAGGLPIGAVLMTQRVASAMPAGGHGSTFAGGALVCAAACHVFDRISAPQFLDHVREVGDYLFERLEEINSPHIKEVRGRGLMVGVELDIDVAHVVSRGYKHGLLLVGSGQHVLRVIPPLIVEKSHVDSLIERLTAILSEL